LDDDENDHVDGGVDMVQEKTELEEQRQVLAKEVQSYRSKISQLEEDLLFRLSNSKVHPDTLGQHGENPQSIHCALSSRLSEPTYRCLLPDHSGSCHWEVDEAIPQGGVIQKV